MGRHLDRFGLVIGAAIVAVGCTGMLGDFQRASSEAGAGGSAGTTASGGNAGATASDASAGAAGTGGTSGSAGAGGSPGAGGGGSAGTGGTAGSSGSGGSAGAGGASTCARPVLLVGEEDTSNTNKPGRVLRFSLAGTPRRCPDLEGGGALPSQPFAIAWIPPDLVAVASRGEVAVVNPATDLEVWKQSYGNGAYYDFPFDIFPLTQSSGSKPSVAVAAGQAGSQMYSIATFSHAGATGPVYNINSTSFPLGIDWVSITADPLAPGHFLALAPLDNIAMQEVDPATPATVGAGLADTTDVLSTIYALDGGGGKLRVAWVGNAAGPDTSDSVYYLTANNMVSPPIGCRDRTCEYEHAVPDPTDPTRYIALCGHSGSLIRQVVRFRSTDTKGTACEVLFDGATLSSSKRLSRLAVIPK